MTPSNRESKTTLFSAENLLTHLYKIYDKKIQQHGKLLRLYGGTMTETVEDSVDTLIKNKKKFLTKYNIKKLKEFDQCDKAKERKETTRYNQIRTLIFFISKINKDFKDITRNDIEAYLASRIKKKIEKTSLDQDKITIKKFYKWFYKNEDTYPELVKWIKTSNTYNYKKPSDLLTNEEIKKLIDACENERDRTIIALFDDASIRIGECANLNVGDVNFHGDNVSICVNGKTGEREIGLITSVHKIIDLLNHHPYSSNPKSPLFLSYSTNYYHQRLGEHSIYCMLKTIAKKAGIKKNVTAHLFRHGSLSRYAKLGLTEPELRIHAGWAKNSTMTSVYIHMTSADVDKKRKQLTTGQIPETEKMEPSALLPRPCPRCNKLNDSGNSYCNGCWLPLNRNVDRDLNLFAMVSSKFLECEGIDVDAMMKKYQYFKVGTRDIERLLNCFNGGTSIPHRVVQRTLNMNAEECLEFLSYLVSAELIDITDDMIVLLDRNKYEEFLLMHKRYIEPAT